jgi:hypothetical protein
MAEDKGEEEGGIVGPLAVVMSGFEEEGGFHETFLSSFSPSDAEALRRVSGMVFGYNLEFGKPWETESADMAREPFIQWAAVGKDLRYIARFLEELGGTIQEIPGFDKKEAETIGSRARERSAVLTEMAALFEAEVEAARV